MLQDRLRILLACLLLIVPSAVSAGMAQGHASYDTSDGQDETAGVRIELDEKNGRADIHIRGEYFTTYLFHEQVRIPYLWPVHAEGGELTLRVRYYIHSGDVDEAEVAEQYRKYADTP